MMKGSYNKSVARKGLKVSKAPPTLSPQKRFLRDIANHADKWRGMSNKLVEKLARGLCSKNFRGVFAADSIPVAKLAGRPRFIVILNLARERPGPLFSFNGHFVSIVAYPNSIRYFDPYGLPCTQPDVKDFLSQCQRPIRQNRQQIQDKKSVYCGMYCLLFAAYNDRKNSSSPPGFKLTFHKRKEQLKLNDTKCVQYLRRLTSDCSSRSMETRIRQIRRERS